MGTQEKVFALNAKMTERFNEIVNTNLEEAKDIAEKMFNQCFNSGLATQAQHWADLLPTLQNAVRRLKIKEGESVTVDGAVVAEEPIVIIEEEQFIEVVEEPVVAIMDEEEVSVVYEPAIVIEDDVQEVEIVDEPVVEIEEVDATEIEVIESEIGSCSEVAEEPKRKGKKERVQ